MSVDSTGSSDERIARAAAAPGVPLAITSGDREQLRGPFPRPGAYRRNPKEGASLGSLVADMPRLFIQLAKDELEAAKRELTAKGKRLGMGAGLLAVAGFFALTLWAVLVTAAILGLNEAFAPWLSALIVAGAFLFLTILFALGGVVLLRRGTPIAPEQTIDSLKQDVNAVKGLGQYE